MHRRTFPLAAIRRFARRIAERFQPDKIILFGSYAYGKPHEESDVDMLVIMRTRNAIDQSIRISLAFERLFSLDLIVRTPWQIERGLKDDNWFLREIIEKGKVLYEARDRQVGSKGERDWEVAHKLAGENPPPRDIVCFHCQQAAEKYVKATSARKRTRGSKDS